MSGDATPVRSFCRCMSSKHNGLLSARVFNAQVITFLTKIGNSVIAQQIFRVLFQDKTRGCSLMHWRRTLHLHLVTIPTHKPRPSCYLMLGKWGSKGGIARGTYEAFCINATHLTECTTRWNIQLLASDRRTAELQR
jgi:hypothetical protein